LRVEIREVDFPPALVTVLDALYRRDDTVDFDVLLAGKKLKRPLMNPERAIGVPARRSFSEGGSG
jgi:hypothetical protein